MAYSFHSSLNNSLAGPWVTLVLSADMRRDPTQDLAAGPSRDPSTFELQQLKSGMPYWFVNLWVN